MKRWIAVLLCIGLMLSVWPALAGGTVTEVMCVVNCNEWVSLRKETSTSSKRLAEVHLGELVTHCHDAGNGFIYCEYKGKSGYIASQYLGETPYYLSDGPMCNQMVTGCEEWVSLRQQPDTSSTRLAKVPLGAVVTSCVKLYSDSFVYCRYNGKSGYIAKQYLTEADYSWQADMKKTYPAVASRMKVVNCSEWVSLRDLPSSNATRLVKVPLGATVDNCRQATEQFIRCTYNGKTGYIMKKYLAEAETKTEPVTNTQTDTDTAPQGFDRIGYLPGIDQFCAVGNGVLDELINGYRVIARVTFTDDAEQLKAVCYNSFSQPMWTVSIDNQEQTELVSLSAFIVGTDDNPLLVMFKAGQGFEAYKIGPWQGKQWEIRDDAAQDVSGGLCAVRDKDGTAYVAGLYDKGPTAVAPDGHILWQAVNTNSSIYWPYDIRISEEGILVYYDSYYENDSQCYVICFDRQGEMLWQQVTMKPAMMNETENSSYENG